jgi:pimeloyl-ACP methyl ester carboxylesterase
LREGSATMKTGWIIRAGLAAGVIAATSASPLHGLEACVRIMAQDSTFDNLVDPPGYKTAKLGTLGGVARSGTGTQPMILIPGLGFGGDVFTEFMASHSAEYRMFAVTLPGFAGTAAPPCPSPETSFGAQTWTNGALAGIEQLLQDENIHDAIVVGHWLTGTQLAIRLALAHPKDVKAVVLLAGSPRSVYTDPAYAPHYSTPERRVATIDKYLAPRWFKTVTRETWDDNNFLPQDYAVNPVRASRLWRAAASPPLHVWIRYLCEFNAQDLSLVMPKVNVPTLILEPGLEGLWYEDGQNYMKDTFCHKSWEGCIESNPRITAQTIPNSRACLWFDQPEAVNEAISSFLKSVDRR